MRMFWLLLLITGVQPVNAQHCPWDCSGMVLVETSLSPGLMEKINFIVSDENKKPVIDTISSDEGSTFYDTCRLYSYSAFLKKRKEQLKAYHWFNYDTGYHFAENKYLLRFNFCRYEGKKLFLSFAHPYTRNLQYIYIEIPAGKRISLHSISDLLYAEDYTAISKEIASMIIRLNCKDLRRRDCGEED